MRTCQDCNQSLPLSSFYFSNKANKKTGEIIKHYYTRCKQCSKEHTSKLPSRQQEYRNTYLKGWRESNADRLYDMQRGAHLLRTYGLSNDEYQALRQTQNSCCAICNTSEDTVFSVGKHSHTKLYVDHDHVTGKVRGLLCHSCNTLLGKANDDTSLLLKSIHYLERNKYVE